MEEIVLIERGPLRAAAFSWQTNDWRKVLTVMCKVTYKLAVGHSSIAAEQEHVVREGIHWGRVPRNSLQAASEFVPFKRGVDVVVTGHVYAPRAIPASSVTARVVIGGFRKSVIVYGDRSRSFHGECGAPAEFTKMPLCWERAAGGPGTNNPLGMPTSSAWMPNFETAGSTKMMGPITPAGMGPIAPQWPERVQRLGMHAFVWDHANWSTKPLPRDIDAGYFNCAPSDQQLPHIDPLDTIELDNLHPELPHLKTKLPPGFPRAVLRSSAMQQQFHLRCDTIWIDTDRGICCVTWRGSQPLESTHGTEVVAAMSTSGNDPISASTLIAKVIGSDDDPSRTTLVGLQPVLPGALPFARGSSVLAAERADASSAPNTKCSNDAGATQMISLEHFVPELPFVTTRSASGDTSDNASTFPETRVLEPAPLPVTPAFIIPEPRSDDATDSFERRAQKAPVLTKPASIGPIVIAPETQKSATPETEATLGAENNLSIEVPIPEFDPGSVSVKSWAEITAEIHKSPGLRSEILKNRGLRESEFSAVDTHWKKALDQEAAELGFASRFVFDAAYVGKLEALRGTPITAGEYARLLKAGAPARAANVLRDIDMPVEAHLPIVRQWTAKLARNRKISAELTQSMLNTSNGSDKPTVGMNP